MDDLGKGAYINNPILQGKFLYKTNPTNSTTFNLVSDKSKDVLEIVHFDVWGLAKTTSMWVDVGVLSFSLMTIQGRYGFSL